MYVGRAVNSYVFFISLFKLIKAYYVFLSIKKYYASIEPININ
jgi:hypothetical protein